MASSECCVPAPPSTHSCVGSEECWQGIDVYVNRHSPSSNAAVVLISDVFGWKTPLLRSIADKVAAAGFVAVVPDFLYGDSFTNQSCFQEWLSKHQTYDKPVEDSRKLTSFLQSKGIDSVGFAGFCWGAKVALIVAKDDCCSAVVLCHPSFITFEDIKACKAPLAILGAEVDDYTSKEKINEFREHLEQAATKDHFVKIFAGTSHGWVVRYDVNDAVAVRNAEEAHKDLIAWFRKTLWDK